MHVMEESVLNALKSVEGEIKDLRIFYDYVKNSTPSEEYISKVGFDPRGAILKSIASHIEDKKIALQSMLIMLPEKVAD